MSRKYYNRQCLPSALMKSVAVNTARERCDVFIGRDKKDHERGKFGNPYEEWKYGREECLRKYKDYFYARLEMDMRFREAVHGLRGKRLGCFCKPLACHGDIICDYLNY